MSKQKKQYSEKVWEIYRECGGTISLDEIAEIEGEKPQVMEEENGKNQD